MLKKTINYTDYDGNEREETFYFNLSTAELIELRNETNGGLEKLLQKMVETKNEKEMVAYMKYIILKAYGEKSLDGKYFRKSKEISEDFLHSEAYSVLFTELAQNDKALANFVNGILPKKVTKTEKEETAE